MIVLLGPFRYTFIYIVQNRKRYLCQEVSSQSGENVTSCPVSSQVSGSKKKQHPRLLGLGGCVKGGGGRVCVHGCFISLSACGQRMKKLKIKKFPLRLNCCLTLKQKLRVIMSINWLGAVFSKEIDFLSLNWSVLGILWTLIYFETN